MPPGESTEVRLAKLEQRDQHMLDALDDIKRAIEGLTNKLSNGISDRITRCEERISNNTKIIWCGLIPIGLLVVKAAVDFFGK